eukprot:10603450-Alexandrium_andersonii.AAC.1
MAFPRKPGKAPRCSIDCAHAAARGACTLPAPHALAGALSERALRGCTSSTPSESAPGKRGRLGRTAPPRPGNTAVRGYPAHPPRTRSLPARLPEGS